MKFQLLHFIKRGIEALTRKPIEQVAVEEGLKVLRKRKSRRGVDRK